jgi:hypothetical protein
MSDCRHPVCTLSQTECRKEESVLRFLPVCAFLLWPVWAFAQQTDAVSPSASNPESTSAAIQSKAQPKRILGVMPNYRAVSPGEVPPPPTPKQALKIASENNFDYSAFVFAGITTLMAEGANGHPQLGKGAAGFGRYYWRGIVDRTDGNYMVIFALPTLFHEDERFYAKGEGSAWKRGIYAASRVLITPNYQGHNTFNASEVFGRGIACRSSRWPTTQTRTAQRAQSPPDMDGLWAAMP